MDALMQMIAVGWPLGLAGFILGDNPPGAAASRGWLVMLDHQNLEGGDASIDKIRQRRPSPPVDEANGEMPQNIYDMRANAFFKYAGQLGPHPRQDGGGGKQAVDFGWSSWVHSGSGPVALPWSKTT